MCVDLDGTLVRTDLLFESFFSLLKTHPLEALRVPLWLFRGGKHGLKAEIAARVDFSEVELPYHEELLEFVQAERAHRRTVLVTGTHQSLADAVALRTGVFDEVRGSDETVNLTGANKRDWLVRRFGEGRFDYVGNDRDDLIVWPAAREMLVVSSPEGIVRGSDVRFMRVFDDSSPRLRDYLGLIRAHQWAKNALIAVPFLLDQRLGDAQALFAVVLAFFAMSLLASATYIVNDLLDLQSDRLNRTKARRALPSGRVPIRRALLVIIALLVAVAAIAAFMPHAFNVLLLVYLVLTLLYSFVLKRKVLVDVITIAALHTLRVIGGTLVIGAEWSFWLLAFSVFVFFSLALAKRVAELANLVAEQRDTSPGRGYTVDDMPILTMMGVSTGYLSVLIVALYINGEKVQRLYDEPMLLWLVCPVLIYWIGRLWMMTSRGLMHEDPIVFALKDRVSLYTALVLGSIVAVATVFRS